ncbi:hypothetical protein KZ829_18095 [Actinoplanes hulinensis]|uniref:Uncharacterized protein n=1 Tax=Actinoplanes hulinensis TaxID=1144547 RepID=A0ABS7B3Q8_9ACTN|nr:hypothetical protein [Actinoplanes hulinensis]MBW6435656.1 hypothetical protein [Actinoplanes hulinensis]
MRSGPSDAVLLFDGEISVHYRFLWLVGGSDWPELVSARAGQRNGILGAAAPGILSMITGLHTGRVPFRVEWHDSEPPVDPWWEDVVEVSYQPPGTEVALCAFEQFVHLTLPRADSLRARFCAEGMDEGAEQDTAFDEDPGPDRYLLALWPAPPAPEAIVRETSDQASYWHQVARGARRA